MSLDIRSGYAGRTMFITGGTGFVGKVLLYKLLKEFPDINKIYLLMRGKKSRKLKKYLNPQERLEMELLGSPCFDPLRTKLGPAAWRALASKVHAVNGDITLTHLGLSDADLAKVTSETQLIVHLAATVNFNERLDLAVQMNTLGGLRVLGIAKACPRLEAMVHVSTCYVNYSRSGPNAVNKEQIYPNGFDAEDMCKHLLALSPKEVPLETERLLTQWKFPNTYTFTKNIGEQLIHKYKEGVPVVVVRPSIVGSSLIDPVPGWVDALTAAGGILLTAAMGVLREFVCYEDLVADIVPVDYVVNVIIKAQFRCQQHYMALRAGQAAGQAAPPAVVEASAPSFIAGGVSGSGKASTTAPALPAQPVRRVSGTGAAAAQEVAEGGEVVTSVAGAGDAAALPFIYQAATSGTLNHITWAKVKVNLFDYCKSVGRHPRGLSKADVTVTRHWPIYLLRFYTLRYVPYLALRGAVAVPALSTPERRKQVMLMGRALRRAMLLNREFYAFVTREWRFDIANSAALDEGLCEESKRAFCSDPYAINWWIYIRQYAYGLLKYIVGDTNGLPLDASPKETPAEILARAAHL